MTWLPPPTGAPVPLPPPRGARPPADYPGCPDTVIAAMADGRTLRVPRWGIPDAIATVVGSIVLAVVGAVVLLVVQEVLGKGSLGGWDLIIGLVFPWLALAGWPIIATVTRGNGPRIDLGLRLRWSDVGWGVVGGIAALVVGIVASAITVAVTGDFSSAAGDAAQDLADSGYRPALLAFALMVSVGAPIVEELAFRGIVFNSLVKRGWYPWVSVAVTAVAFALFHFEPQRLLVLVSIGVVLGIVRVRTRALGSCMVAHGINNLPGAIYLVTL